MPRQTILATTDGTVTSRAALRIALGLARDTSASLVVLHVVEPPTETLRSSRSLVRGEREAYGKLLKRQTEAAERRIRNQLQQIIGPARRVELRILVKSGRVVETVLELALTLDAALLVLGKGRRSAELSQSSEHIARASLRPVLLVPGKWQRALGTRAPKSAGGLRSSTVVPRPRAQR